MLLVIECVCREDNPSHNHKQRALRSVLMPWCAAKGHGVSWGAQLGVVARWICVRYTVADGLARREWLGSTAAAAVVAAASVARHPRRGSLRR